MRAQNQLHNRQSDNRHHRYKDEISISIAPFRCIDTHCELTLTNCILKDFMVDKLRLLVFIAMNPAEGEFLGEAYRFVLIDMILISI